MVEKNNLSDELLNNIAQIAQELVAGRIGFLFGSGMSISSGGIDGENLAYQLIKDSYFLSRDDSKDQKLMENIKKVSLKYPLEAIVSGIAKKAPFEKTSLKKILKDITFPKGKPEYHEGHSKLATIIEKLETISMLFTTNWDTLISDRIGESSEIVTPDNYEDYIFDLEIQKLNKILVVHLHGTFNDSPLICEEDLIDFEKPLFQIFLGELMTKAFVFVGYSLSDPNIKALYYKASNLLIKMNKKLHKKTYIVFPSKNEVEEMVSKCTWEARNAVYIPLTAEVFFVELHRAIETYALNGLKEEIRIRLGHKDMSLVNQRISEIGKVFPEFDSDDKSLLYLYSITKGR